MNHNSLGLGQTATHKRCMEFLGAMKNVVPWANLVALASPFLP